MKLMVRLARTKNSMPYTIGKLFAEGVEKSGDTVVLSRTGSGKCNPSDLLEYDLFVSWSLRHLNTVTPIRALGRDILTMELGYIGDREKWISLGYNGINGNAEHVIGNEPRWEKLWGSKILKPWSMAYDHVLLVGQVKRDMSVVDCRRIFKWYQSVTKHYCKQGLPVTFRRHPKDRRRVVYPEGATIENKISLAEAMKNALVVTWSSNVGVEAVLAGRPTIALSPISMVHGWAGRNLDEINSFDREPWLHRMAYCQWHLDELADGSAWRHYRERYSGNKVRDTIKHRRSCRSFTKKSIPKEMMWKILEAGMWAPSGSNLQNVRFIVLDDEEEIQMLGDSKLPHGLVKSASVAVAVLSTSDVSGKKSERHIWQKLLTQNCSAAIQNMLLMATDLRIGSCWISFLDVMDGTRMLSDKSWRELFATYNIPPQHSIHGLVLFGWPKKLDGPWPVGDKMHGNKPVEGRTLNRFLIGKK